MCGRYTLSTSPEEIAAEFADDLALAGIAPLAETFEWEPRYNIAPSQYSLVCVEQDQEPIFKAMRWGLIPHWAKDEKIGYKLINARAETVAEKPSFRTAFKRRRCIVFSDGYYEWTKQVSGKQPVYIQSLNATVMPFAGLWEQWQHPEKGPLQTFSIITVGANAELEKIHHRMPVVLDPRQCQQWLSAESEPEAIFPLLQPAPNGTFTYSFVSTFVNSPRHEGPQCIQAIAEN